MFAVWNFFIQKRQFTILLMIALIIGGTLSLIAIPKESAPEVRIPIAVVSTTLPGASASDVEELITNKLEDGLQSIENLDTMQSSSAQGVSVITVQFTASADLDKSIQDVKDAVDLVKPKLPSEANDPIVSDVNFADQPILILSVSGEYLPAQLTSLGNDLESELSALPNVSRVDVSGVSEREVQVVVDTRKLGQYGISISQVTSAIQSANTTLPLGSLEISNVAYSLSFEGDIASASEVSGIVVTTTQSGAPIYVRDIATVNDGVSESRTLSRVSNNGEPAAPALTLNIYKSSGGNIVQVSDSVKTRLDELQEDGVIDGDVVIVLDSGEQVKKDLGELTTVGLQTVTLVMITLLLTIGWREATVAGLSIPLSFLIAFIGLYASGNTINFVSLFSLILAIGILVDSGIVVTEAIHTRLSKYTRRREAAQAALREYGWPLIAGTMTTVAVFVPLFFISGVVGEFIASIPFTIIFVLIASIFVALGLVPMLTILLTPKTDRKENRLEKLQEEYTEKARTWYKDFLGRLLENRRRQTMVIWSMIGGFILVMSLPVVGLIPAVFFPGGDVDFVYIELELPVGTTLEATDLAVRPIEEVLYDNKNVASFVTTVGSGSAFSGGDLGSSAGGGSLANITVNLLEADQRDVNSQEFSASLRKELSQFKTGIVHVYEPSDGPPSGAPVSVTFSSNDFAALDTAISQARTILENIEGTTDISTSEEDGGSAFIITLNKQRAAQLGISPATVASTLRTAINGTTATNIREDGNDVDIVVKAALDGVSSDPNTTNHATPDSIRALSIPTANGSVLLGSIVSIDITRAQTSIAHKDRERIGSVSAYITTGTNAISVNSELIKQLEEQGLPDGVTLSVGGETEDVQRSFAEMGIAFIAGIILMLGILVLEFNSFRNSLFLLSVIPLSMIGVFLGLLILRQPLSFSSLLGIIALAGVIINHAIILMDSINRIRAEQPELDNKNVIIEASTSRLRPIVLTTITTVVGMIPLLSASALWSPLAAGIMFGLAFSTLLTLVLIPILTFRWPVKEV